MRRIPTLRRSGGTPALEYGFMPARMPMGGEKKVLNKQTGWPISFMSELI